MVLFFANLFLQMHARNCNATLIQWQCWSLREVQWFCITCKLSSVYQWSGLVGRCTKQGLCVLLGGLAWFKSNYPFQYLTNTTIFAFISMEIPLMVILCQSPEEAYLNTIVSISLPQRTLISLISQSKYNTAHLS